MTLARHLAQQWSKTHDSGKTTRELCEYLEIRVSSDSDGEKTKKKYPELFYYFDGLYITKIITVRVHIGGHGYQSDYSGR
jgi:hypothetical protein